MADPVRAQGAVAITPETLARVAVEILGVRLSDQDSRAIADLLNAIRGETEVLKSFDLGPNDPATMYQPGEIGP